MGECQISDERSEPGLSGDRVLPIRASRSLVSSPCGDTLVNATIWHRDQMSTVHWVCLLPSTSISFSSRTRETDRSSRKDRGPGEIRLDYFGVGKAIGWG
jgi:hypothetical protein